MNRLRLVFIFLIAIPLSGYAQLDASAPSRKVEGLRSHYDRFADFTVIETQDYNLERKPGSCSDLFTVRAAFIHKGQKLAEGLYYLTYVCRGSSWTFDVAGPSLIFLSGDSRLRIGQGDRSIDSGSNSMGFYTYETVSFKILPGDLITIASAKTNEFKIGRIEQALPENARKGIEGLLANSEPNRVKRTEYVRPKANQ